MELIADEEVGTIVSPWLNEFKRKLNDLSAFFTYICVVQFIYLLFINLLEMN